jgi:hypothetical protein
MIHASFATYLADINNGLQVLADIYSHPQKKERPFTLEELQHLQRIMLSIMHVSLEGEKNLFVEAELPESVIKAFEAYNYKFNEEGGGYVISWTYHEPKD